MDRSRWQQIDKVFNDVLERAPEERDGFLEWASAGDEELRREVSILLAARERAGAFLAKPALADATDESAVESLHAAHPRAEKSMAPPALEAVGGALAEYQQAEAAAGSAAQIHELAAEVGRRPRSWWALPPWWILLLSVPFITSAGFLYFRLFFGPEPVGLLLGWDNPASSEGWNRITAVLPKSPAARAGFQSGDLIASKDLDQFRTHPLPDQFRFQVKRRGESMELTLALKEKRREYWMSSQAVRALLLTLDSALYLILAGILVVVRPRDSLARWGTLLLAQLGIQMLLMVNRAGTSTFIFESAHALRTLPIPLELAILAGMSVSQKVPAGALGFLGGFPRAFLTGWRAWVFWLLTIVVTTPMHLKQFWLPVYAGASGPEVPEWLLMPGLILGTCWLAATIVLLTRNYRRIEGRSERRRLRMVVAGFGVGVIAMAIVVVLAMPVGPIQRFRESYWGESYLNYALPLLFAFAPVCTAYAILRHRIFDIHVMVRLGLRYAAARRLLLSIIPATALVLVLDLVTHGNQPLLEIARRRGLLYAAIAFGAFLLHARQKVWLNALDRRFFREHYDARRILSDVVDDVRHAGTFDLAASQVVSQIEGSLHSRFASILVREPGAVNFCAVAPAGATPAPIPADSNLIVLMQASGKPLENSQSQPDRLRQQLPPHDVEYLQKTRAEWLFPVTLGGTGPEAVLVLGPKRSEEPYSQEDRDLLSAITGSLALLLERSPAAAPVQAGFGECPQCGNCYDSGVALCDKDGSGLSTSPYALTLARRYRFERRLGRGGMGTVYQAQDTELQRRVAVKVIRPELMPGMDALARFRWEAKAAARFAHPNVVTVYDFSVAEDNRAYLVMELLSGCSLRQELSRCGRLDPKRVLDILSGVSSAVAAAHDHKLLHRDLKPENIFLTQSGSEEVAKILDFGLAKLMARDVGMESIPSTAHGMLVGTLPYMSPERIRGGTPMESWDIWALAVIAFEMLTGVHPFSTLTTWGSILIEDHFPPVDENAPALTPQLQEFFKHSLTVDRSQRPRSAHHFLVELQAAL